MLYVPWRDEAELAHGFASIVDVFEKGNVHSGFKIMDGMNNIIDIVNRILGFMEYKNGRRPKVKEFWCLLIANGHNI